MTQRWQYQVIEIGPKIFEASQLERMNAELNRLGALGWELVSTEYVGLSGSTRLYLKKEA